MNNLISKIYQLIDCIAVELNKKVNKVPGKGFSTNDFSNAYAYQLDNLDGHLTDPNAHQAEFAAKLDKGVYNGTAADLKADIDQITALLASDDINLDELQEIVDFIKANKDSLDNLDITSISGLVAALEARLETGGYVGSAQDLKDEIDTVSAIATTAIQTETDPVFTASEASNFAAGDKAKLDSAVQPESLSVVATSGDYNDLSNIPSSGQLVKVTEGNANVSGYRLQDADPEFHGLIGSDAVDLSHQNSSVFNHEENDYIANPGRGAVGYYSHAEGLSTFAEGWASHAEGDNTSAKGSGSHAEGIHTVAFGSGAHAQGYNTFANSFAEYAGGCFGLNITSFDEEGNDITDVLAHWGNGMDEDNRSDAFQIYKSGQVVFMPLPDNATTTIPNPKIGAIIFNTTTGNFEGYNGTEWVNLSLGKVSVNGVQVDANGDVVIPLTDEAPTLQKFVSYADALSTLGSGKQFLYAENNTDGVPSPSGSVVGVTQ